MLVNITVGTFTIWQAYSWARDWFDDALNETRVSDHRSRRREVLFSVCFAESYLFEWVRDDVLKGDYQKLANYFPFDSKRGLRRKWKEVIKQLKRDSLIQNIDFGGPAGAEWVRLVKYRDGLVHARASRPSTPTQEGEKEPVPSKTILDQLQPGWALKTVNDRIRKLHDAANTAVPSWLVDP